MSHDNTRFIAFGHRCSASAILDRCQLAAESLPFDGLVSKLNVIRDCLENDFKEFLNLSHYEAAETKTVNIIDGVVEEILTEHPSINRHYEETNRPIAGVDLTGSSTYHLQLAFTHDDLSSPETQKTILRRVRRLLDVLAQSRRKVCFYIHPLMGMADYEKQKRQLVEEFSAFSLFLSARYPNISGLYFILVKVRGRPPETSSTLICKDASTSVYAIFVNEHFIDASAPFTGNCEREIQVMMDIVQRPEFSTPANYRIYFPLFEHSESESNEMRLTHEGLLAHPQVTLVDRPESADYVVLCQNHLVEHNPLHVRFRPIKEQYKAKTVLLDYGDDPGMVFDADDFRWRLYFKRSVVDREQGRIMDYGGLAVRSTAYCVVDDMCTPPAESDHQRKIQRKIDISCLFEDSVVETPHFALARGRLLKFAKRLAATHRNLAMQIGTVSECGPVGRSRIDPKYKQCLYDSKIVLHANPDFWEGDSRLWEALASGALVFVDRLHAPLEHALIDGEHLVLYDLTDEGLAILEQKVLHYLQDEGERQRIGQQGRQFALDHHRSVNRVGEIIRALENTTPTAAPAVGTAPPLDIIVSIATGYQDVDQYRQFISTLRRTGATCPVFLGISDGPEYEPVKKYLLENAVNYFIVPPISPPHKVVNGYRFAQYRLWLQGLQFRYALMMDFRDAYFQRDPFSDIERFMHDCDLYLMSEFVLLTVGNHPNGMNYDWVNAPFGKEIADAVADKVILNSGAILGRRAAVMKLLDAFTEVTASQNFEFADQGTLNYLAHAGRLGQCGRIKTVRAGESLVNNCGFTELDLLRETRSISAEDEARIAFIPRTEAGRLKLLRDHDGFVLDDDGNVSYAVHQYDRFADMDEFVARLSHHECSHRVFVNSGNRTYQGETYTLSSRTGLKPGAVERLQAKMKSLPVHRKPLLVIDDHFKRGFVFAYGVLNVELRFESEAFQQRFFAPTHNGIGGHDRARFLEKWGYEMFFVDESDIFLAPETARSPTQVARSFSEARAHAERWTQHGTEHGTTPRLDQANPFFR